VLTPGREDGTSPDNSEKTTAAVAAAPAIGRTVALTSAVFFGMNTSLARMAYDGGSNPGTTVLLRVALSVVAVAALLGLTGRRLHVPRQAVLPLLGVAAAIAFQGISYLSSVAYIPVGLAALLFYTFPLMVALSSRIIDGVPIGRKRSIAFAVCFVGLGLAIGPSFESMDWRGIVLALMGAVGVTCIYLSSAVAVRHVDAAHVTLLGNLGSLPLMAVAVVFLGGLQLPQTAMGWSGLAGVGVCYTLAYLTYFAAIARIGATRTALLFNLEALVSIAAAHVLLGESLSPTQYVGAGIVIAALIAADWRSQEKTPGVAPGGPS